MKTWVFALPTNKEFWAWDGAKRDYTPRVVTTEQARRIVAETQRALDHWARLAPAGSTPYTPPVLREHVREGARCGSIVGIKLSGILERRGIWLHVDWLDATYEDIEAYKSQHVSIGTVPSYRDGSGEVFGPIVDELSLTEHPRLRGIGSIQDTLTLRLSDAMEVVMTEEEILALLEPYIKRIESLEAMVLEKEPEDEPPVDGEGGTDAADEGGAEEDKEEKELEARLADMETRMVDNITSRIVTQLADQRLGSRPAAAPPAGKTPQTPAEKLAAAKMRGLRGMDAINAALK